MSHKAVLRKVAFSVAQTYFANKLLSEGKKVVDFARQRLVSRKAVLRNVLRLVLRKHTLRDEICSIAQTCFCTSTWSVRSEQGLEVVFQLSANALLMSIAK